MTMITGVLFAAVTALAVPAAPTHVDVHIGSPSSIVELATMGGLEDPARVVGIARWWPTEGPPEVCEIFVPPLTRATLSTWTHELRHCTEGYFH